MKGDNVRALHTHTDTYDHFLEDDLKQPPLLLRRSFTISRRDERIPRKAVLLH